MMLFILACAWVVAAAPRRTPPARGSAAAAGCSAPVGAKWDRWDMAGSTYNYCYKGCHVDWLIAHKATHPALKLGAYAGVVGVDHYWTKQGMPCVDGEPTEFANQDAFAIKWKTTFPGTRVLEYRITDAVFYDPLVYDKMQTDPDFFVRFKNGSVCQTAPKAGKKTVLLAPFYPKTRTFTNTGSG